MLLLQSNYSSTPTGLDMQALLCLQHATKYCHASVDTSCGKNAMQGRLHDRFNLLTEL